ncbi:MAG: ABC transporter ATP-binding protein [Smithellaceae bacterium]|nr:ABC transporter ATP-binding protein [Smithellaceae bacterium]
MSLNLKKPKKLYLRRALSLLWKAAPGWAVLSTVFLVLQAALPLAQLYLMKLTVDAVTVGITSPGKDIVMSHVLTLIGLLGASALAAVFLASAAKVVGQAQAQIITDHVQSVLHGKSVALDMEYYENAGFYDTLHRAQQEAPHRPTSILNGLIQVVQSGVTLVGIATLLFSVHWGIAAVLCASLIPGLFFRIKYADRMFQWQSDRSATDRAATYFNWLITSQYYAKEVRLYDLGPLFIKRFRDLRQLLRREKIGIAFRYALTELVAEAFATLAIFGSLAFIAYRTVQGMMTLGDMVMYYQAFQRAQGYLKEMLNGLASLYEDNLFLSNFYDFLDLKPTIIEPAKPEPVPRPMQKGIVFDHIDFRYPTGEAMVLKDINISIRPGQVVALVGENGSGKTTLVKLLCRLYDPTAGKITVDGIDLSNFDTTALRREIGIIFQDYVQYQMTVRENIWMGNTRLAPDDEKIVAAAKYSGADDVIAGLPLGYETMLGKWFGNGAELSIGQWQKVALARAFLRDAQIIVLDEPTSSMDAKAEYAVFQNLRELAQGRTVIFISHRFSTIRMADCIYVLKDGGIAEEGTHEELVHLDGIYAHLFEIQAKYYR